MTNYTLLFGTLRLLATPVLLLASKSPLIMAFLLLVLDVLDCSRYHQYVVKGFGNNDIQCTHNFLYQATDKLSDIFQYAIAILILGNTVSQQFFLLLLTWRTLGVIAFLYTKDTRYLVPFFDGIKEMMFLWWLCNGNPSMVFIILICVAKITFEAWKNG